MSYKISTIVYIALVMGIVAIATWIYQSEHSFAEVKTVTITRTIEETETVYLRAVETSASSNKVSYSTTPSSFGLCIAKLDGKILIFYLADNPKLWFEGYRNKTSIDFMGVGASGMIFLNRDGWSDQIILDMNVPLGNRLGVGGVIQVGNKLVYIPLNLYPIDSGLVKVYNIYAELGAKMVAFIEYDKSSSVSDYLSTIHEMELECTR